MVDVIGETFTKKYYFVKASDCLVKNCLHFIASFMKCPGEYFFGLVVRMILLMNIIFLILKSVIKECSNYHFHYFLISNDKYVNKYFWRNFVLSTYFWRIFTRTFLL